MSPALRARGLWRQCRCTGAARMDAATKGSPGPMHEAAPKRNPGSGPRAVASSPRPRRLERRTGGSEVRASLARPRGACGTVHVAKLGASADDGVGLHAPLRRARAAVHARACARRRALRFVRASRCSHRARRLLEGVLDHRQRGAHEPRTVARHCRVGGHRGGIQTARARRGERSDVPLSLLPRNAPLPISSRPRRRVAGPAPTWTSLQRTPPSPTRSPSRESRRRSSPTSTWRYSVTQPAAHSRSGSPPPLRASPPTRRRRRWRVKMGPRRPTLTRVPLARSQRGDGCRRTWWWP